MWRFPSLFEAGREAENPHADLARAIVARYAQPGNRIVDLTAGSGTIAFAERELGCPSCSGHVHPRHAFIHTADATELPFSNGLEPGVADVAFLHPPTYFAWKTTRSEGAVEGSRRVCRAHRREDSLGGRDAASAWLSGTDRLTLFVSLARYTRRSASFSASLRTLGRRLWATSWESIDVGPRTGTFSSDASRIRRACRFKPLMGSTFVNRSITTSVVAIGAATVALPEVAVANGNPL